MSKRTTRLIEGKRIKVYVYKITGHIILAQGWCEENLGPGAYIKDRVSMTEATTPKSLNTTRHIIYGKSDLTWFWSGTYSLLAPSPRYYEFCFQNESDYTDFTLRMF